MAYTFGPNGERLQASDFRPNTSGLFSDIKRGFGQAVGGLGSALQDVPLASDVGRAIEGYGEGITTRNPASINTFDDVLSSPLVTAREGFGEGVGQIASRLPTMLLGAQLGAVGGPVGILGGALGGAFLPSALQSYGEVRSDQRKTGQEDIGRAALAAAGSGALELLGPEATIARMMGKKAVTEALAREIAQQGAWKFAGKELAKGAAIEGPITEIPQTVLERWGKFQDVATPEALSEYGVAGAKGAAGGGGISAILSVPQRANASAFVDQVDQARGVLAAPIEDAQDMALHAQASRFLEGVTKNDFGLQAAEEQAIANTAQRNAANTGILDRIADTEYASALGREQEETKQQTLDMLRTQWEESRAKAAEAEKEAANRIEYSPATLSDVASEVGAFAPTLEMPGVNFEAVPLPDVTPVAPVQQMLPTMPYGGQALPAPEFDASDRLRAALDQLRIQTHFVPPIEARIEQATIPALLNQRGARAMLSTAEQELAGVNANLEQLQQLSGYTPGIGFGTFADPGQAQLFTTPAKPSTTAQPTAEARVGRTSKRAEFKVALAKAELYKQITPEQHLELINDVDQGVKIPVAQQRLATFMEANQKENQNAVQEQGQAPAQEITAVQEPTNAVQEQGQAPAQEITAVQEPTNAIQEPSANESSIQRGAREENAVPSKAVGQGNTQLEVAAQTSAPQTQQVTQPTKETSHATEAPQAVQSQPSETPEEADPASLLTTPEKDWYYKHRGKHESLAGKYPAEQPVNLRVQWLEDAIEVATTAIAEGRPGVVKAIRPVPNVDLTKTPKQILKQLEAKRDAPDPIVSPQAQATRVKDLQVKMQRARQIATTLRNDSEASQWLAAMERAKKADDETEFNTQFQKMLDAEELQQDRADRKNAGKPADVIDQMDELEADTPVAGVDYGYEGIEGIDFSKTRPEKDRAPTTVARVQQRLREWFVGPEQASRRLTAVQKFSDLPSEVQTRALAAAKVETGDGIQGFVDPATNRAYLIADNIAEGHEQAVFMHEVGAHIGLTDEITSKAARMVRGWANAEEGTTEKQVYDATMKRMQDNSEASSAELVAYAVEESVKAGVVPTRVAAMQAGAKSPTTVQNFINTMAKYFKALLPAFMRADTVNAQQLIDLTYGAAHAAMATDQNVQKGQTEIQFSRAEALPAQVKKFIGPSGVQVWDSIKSLVRTAVLDMTSLPDLVRQYEDRIPALRTMYDALLAAQTRKIELDQDVDMIMDAITQAKLTKAQVAEINSFLLDSTTEQKWAYDPGFKRKVEVDPEFAKRFNDDTKFTPQMREIVKSIFQHGEDTMGKKRAVFKQLGVEDPFKRLVQMQGPYSPLRRWGNYMVEVKSPALVAEEAKQADGEGGFKDTKRIDELRSDPGNYRISFRTTEGAAKRLYNELMATGNYVRKGSYVGVRPERAYTHSEINRSSLVKVLESIKGDDTLSRDIKTKMENTVKALYHQMMEDHLARQSMRQRKYRAGADEDMLQGFFKQARAEASFIANMEHAQKINEATYQVSKNAETQAKEQGLQDVVNMMLNHRKRMLDYKDTPLQDFAVGMTSAWQLATSPGYHLANATQVAMKTVPMLAAEFGDYSGAWGHVNDGYKLWGQMRGEKFDWSKVKNEGLRKTLELASKMNLIDVGMAEDFDQYNTPRTGFESVDTGLVKGRHVLHKLRQASRWVERANRVTAASAAYNMAREKGKTHEAAQAFAIRVLEQTQGDFSQLAAPMIIKRLPKFITQYRKYQLMVGALYVRSMYDAFKGASPAERAVARRMLGYMLAHTSAVGGVLGLPLINLAEIVIPAVLGNDDEPKDLERMLRDWFGDDNKIADMVLKGLPAMLGLDLGAKLSDDRVFSILPYTKLELSKKGLADGLMGLMGPGMSQAGRMLDGIALMNDGQLAQGTEKLMPRGVEDALKAYRIANEGYTLRNGDVLVKPEDINTFQAMLAGVGLPAAELKRYQWIQGQQIEITKFYKERELELKRDYIKAHKEKDMAAQTEAINRWQSLQETKAKMRRYFADQPDELKRHFVALLTHSPTKQREREAKRQETISKN